MSIRLNLTGERWRGTGPERFEPVPVTDGWSERTRLNRIESALVAAIVVMLTLGAWWWTSRPSDILDSDTPVPASTLSEPTTLRDHPQPSVLLVHVAGEVRRPGVVQLAEGARVVDAIEAAGGATASAVLAGVNLAAEVRDGAQIVVPSSRVSAEQTSSGDPLVAINTATATELQELPGVGPVLANRIVAHRDEHGAFDTPEDLLDVSGIGEAILARVRPLLRVP